MIEKRKKSGGRIRETFYLNKILQKIKEIFSINKEKTDVEPENYSG